MFFSKINKNKDSVKMFYESLITASNVFCFYIQTDKDETFQKVLLNS